LACVRLATMLRAQNKAAEAVAVLAVCRQTHEGNLLKDPEAVAQAFGLGPAETQAVRRLDRRNFEQRAVQLRSA
jgi:hypothetical protein